MEFTTKYALTTRIDGKFQSSPFLLSYNEAKEKALELSATQGRAYGVVECNYVAYDANKALLMENVRLEEEGIALAEQNAYGEFCGCGACHECNIGGCEAYYLGVEEVCSHFTHDRDGNGFSATEVLAYGYDVDMYPVDTGMNVRFSHSN